MLKKFAIPSAQPEGKLMVAAGYGGKIDPSLELKAFVTTYHPDLLTKSVEVLPSPNILSLPSILTYCFRSKNKLGDLL